MDIKTHKQYEIVFLPFPERAAFNGSFLLAKSILRRQHRVTYVGPAKFESYVRRQGFEYSVFEPPRQDDSSATEKSTWWTRRRDQILANLRQYDALQVALEGWIGANGIDLVLMDALMWRYSPAFLKSAIPLVATNTTLASGFTITSLPVFSDALPLNKCTWRRYCQNLFEWIKIEFCLKRQWALWGDPLLLFLSAPFVCHPPTPRELVKKYGGVLKWSEYGNKLALPELVFCPAELDFPGQCQRPGRIYAGTCLYDERVDRPFDWSQLQKGRPLVYCSVGTYGKSYRYTLRLFEAVVAALAQQDELQTVIQIGDVAEPSAFGNLPSHVIVAKEVPQLEILRYADIFITHGGLTSIRESIYFGVPMIVFPCRLDQLGNAARIEYHGIGLRADIEQVDACQVKDLIRTLRTGSYRTNIEAMRYLFRQQMDCSNTVDWIEGYLDLRK